MADDDTVFDKILRKEISSTSVYEDHLCEPAVWSYNVVDPGTGFSTYVYAFKDSDPCARTDVLIIPKHKEGLTGLSKAEERHTMILGHLLYTAKVIAVQEGLTDGFRVVINDGTLGGQSVQYLSDSAPSFSWREADELASWLI